MKQSAGHILRVGMAITFLWIGVLILKEPEAWGAYILPRAARLLPFGATLAMIFTAVFDIVVGFLLLLNYLTFWASTLASLHLLLVLTVAGINPITVRDIGLLAGTLALALSSYPYDFSGKQRHS
ncbi:MAG: Uncharacterized protein G01um101430_262 [Parcubacteria group bacterium Gr01-1014_30]|nr:MAG: Uncharacterized protein G01um101430_262 [Parcubacteria group bacterium Gr01-1014_30]